MARIPTRVAVLVGAALIAGGAAAVAVVPDGPSAGRDQGHQGASTAAAIPGATHRAGVAPSGSGAAPTTTGDGTPPAPSSSPGGPQPFTRGSTLNVSACTVNYVISDAAASPSRTTITYQGTPAECASLEATLVKRVGTADPADPGWTVVSVSTVTETTALVTSNDVAPAPGAGSGG